jgi:hypothetical protein
MGRNISMTYDQKIKVEDLSDRILWIDEQCPYCWGRQRQPGMLFSVGFCRKRYIGSVGASSLVNEISVRQSELDCTIQNHKYSID